MLKSVLIAQVRPGAARRFLHAAAWTSAMLMSACGGGGASAPASPAPAPAPVPVSLPAVDVSAVAAHDPGSALPAGWSGGAFMEIYVRAYKDSDGDGIGDLRGLTQSLDYLRDLGIKGIWLMPVTKSEDHDHGYAVSDYRDIESAYGSLADFDELLRQAHARGIGVITDYVMNHSATANALFVNSGASTSNPYRSWYIWQDAAPAGWSIFGQNPWYTTATGAYFAQFYAGMPDFNLRNAATVAYHQDNLRFWLNRGVDGFRFDAVQHLIENGPAATADQPESYALMGAVHDVVNGYAQRFMVCEGPNHPRAWAVPTVCGSAFALDHQADIVGAARGDATAIGAVADYFKSAPATMSTLVSNHDSYVGARLWNQLGGDQAQYRLAAATYLLQPGTPFIYYGEEVGMAGATGLSGDAWLRGPMSWSADARTAGFTTGTPFRALAANAGAQNAASELDANSILSFYKAMLRLRNTLPSIARGSYEASAVSGKLMTYQRRLGSERTLVAINYGGAAATASVTGLPPGATLAAAYPAGAPALAADASGTAQLPLPAQALAVYIVQP
jgi:alpha-amylase